MPNGKFDYRVRTQKYLLVVESELQAQYVFQAFRLDPELWRVIPIGAAINGHPWVRIVVMPSHIYDDFLGRRWLEELKCRVVLGGEFLII